MDFPVFSPDGTMLGNQTSGQGVVPSGNTLNDPLPDTPLPKLPGASISPGQSKFNGWMNWGTSKITGAPSGNATGPDGTNPGASDSPSGSAATGNLSGLLPRITIVILGFIFVAVGLTMFSRGAIASALPLAHR